MFSTLCFSFTLIFKCVLTDCDCLSHTLMSGDVIPSWQYVSGSVLILLEPVTVTVIYTQLVPEMLIDIH